MIKSLNLSDIPEQTWNEMQKDKVEFSKVMSQVASESRKDTKTGKCLYCSVETNKYCNSHSIPASFLRNIAEDGKLYTHGGLIDLPLLKDDTGVNKAGTFLIICRSCDSKIFTEYENKDNYSERPTQKMLAQIAMKNFLKSISKRSFEIALHENLSKNSGFDFSAINKIKDIDLRDNMRGFKRAKKVDIKCIQEEYYLFMFERLDYVVPIAFQSQVALAIDLDGNIINDLYNHNSNYQIKMAHVAIFPLENSSVVMMFIDNKDKRYSPFVKQVGKLSTTKKLELVNYIIFLYSEDFFLSKKVGEEVIKNEALKKLSGETGIPFISPGESKLEIMQRSYSLAHTETIPNLLSKEYSIG